MTNESICLNQITNLRLFLKENFYSREEIIAQLIDQISNCFEVFSVNYEPSSQSIKIKIKITNMKKRFPNYEHDSIYYYEIMNSILSNVLNGNISLLNTLFNHSSYGLNNTSMNISSIPISGLYNITTLLDNIIIVNL